jgi:iron complex outermembrane receptor protein
MIGLNTKLKLGSSLCAFAAAMPFMLSPALAQTQDDSIETVVVTGTSIRGVAPVGSNIITMSTEDIQNTGGQTVAQVLADAPAIEGFGNSGRATANSSNGGPGIAIYIHQLGANGSGSTLVLVDGHRVTSAGVTNYFVDPNTIPAIMLDRVDVLAEGASSIYGSDAVAGVVNFITRKRFDGVQLEAGASFAEGTSTYRAGALVGHSWDSGGFVLGLTYVRENQLKNTSRWWTNPLAQTPAAIAAGLPVTASSSTSTNFGNFNCEPATVQPNGSGNIYLNAQGTTNVANTAANSPCTNWQYGAILPSGVRYNSMLRVNQQIFPRLGLQFDLIVAQRTTQQIQSRGTASGVTVFSTGAQANPFYTNPPGVTATKQSIRYDFDNLLGPGAYQYGGDLPINATTTLSWNVDDNWNVDFIGNLGRNDAYTGSRGTVNTAMADLYLNGTTNNGGSTTQTAIPGYNTVTLNLPLTTANALDVWHPASSGNLTPTTVRQALTSTNNNSSHGVFSIVNLKAIATGTLFDLPGGPVKVAGGLEQLNTYISQFGVKTGGAAGTNVAAQYFDYNFGRNDFAQFVEVDVPVINPDMGIPLIKKLEFNMSLRHDDYSDFGETTNPKVSFNWDIIDGLRLRGNWSTSFVAPPLNLVGGTAGLANFSNVAGGSGGGPIPVQYYPQVTLFGISGCTSASVTCNISSLQGITRSIGDPNAKAAKGRGYTIGVDYSPEYIPGLFLAATYWDTTLLGGMTGPPFNISVTNAALIDHLTLYPSCATQAQVNAFATSLGGQPIPQTSTFPTCVQFTYQGLTSNFYYLYAGGIDAQVNYSVDTGSFGVLTFGETLTQATKFDVGYSFGTAPGPNLVFSTLGSDGINTSFPTLATSSRTRLGWAGWGATADLYMNYSSAYRNVGSPVTPIVNNSFGVWSGAGGDHVGANVTFDLRLSYNFNDGILGDDTIGLQVNNFTNERPPYYNGSSGYDNLVANPVGRTYQISLRTKL